MPAKISGYSTSEPLAPPKGSSSGGVAADKTQADAAAPSSSPPQTADQVTLTSSARSLQKLSDAVAQAPVVNAAKVASIKQALTNGTYQVDVGRVADKIIQFENGLK